MFSLFKKESKIIAPISGDVLDLSHAPDPVFSQRLAGDGVLINPSDGMVVAPADGILSVIFKTNHAFGMKLENGTEVLVHIGIDTVKLNGQGFERIAEEGSSVKAGEPIMKIDRKFITESGFSLMTPVLITNPDETSSMNLLIDCTVTAGKDAVIRYKK
ncbi:PTS glucose transporter subunit IIA [Anoxybacterium hadale]|uniref:PTS glucose transporter subunit IIA n=1 Tax=Anoxybacterium hadale TaxID=3408580 RepID=A0ACD1A642_9FIRM|nr:PTS glucose transporter subunit IIA [Clostridiales bacterium]